MKRKVIIGSILAILMLTLSIVTVVGSETSTAENKESPLYRIRTNRAISERVESIVKGIYTNFLGENRVFFIPMRLINRVYDNSRTDTASGFEKWCPDPTFLPIGETCGIVATCDLNCFSVIWIRCEK
jgi:hypothetical protein